MWVATEWSHLFLLLCSYPFLNWRVGGVVNRQKPPRWDSPQITWIPRFRLGARTMVPWFMGIRCIWISAAFARWQQVEMGRLDEVHLNCLALWLLNAIYLLTIDNLSTNYLLSSQKQKSGIAWKWGYPQISSNCHDCFIVLCIYM